MKEATGELNMTVVTVVAIAAVGALLYTFVWPSIKTVIRSRTCATFGTDYSYNSSTNQCCRSSDDCVNLSDD